MHFAYAMAELRFPSVLKQFPEQGQFWTTAHFLNDTQNDWSLLLWFDKPVTAGETVTIPVTLLVPEATANLFVPEAGFELFLRSNGEKAQGRIISVVEVTKEELHRVFHTPSQL